MKKTLTLFTVSGLLLMASAFTIQAIINWKINSDKAQVKFTMQAHGQELIGSFGGAKGEIKFDESDLANSSFKCTIDAATVNTGMEGRDKHLQAKDFFNVAEFPLITFTSSKVEGAKEGYTATGNLSLKGVTKPVVIAFTFTEFPEGGNIFKGSYTIKRSDFGVGKTGGDISDDVTINLEIPVTKD